MLCAAVTVQGLLQPHWIVITFLELRVSLDAEAGRSDRLERSELSDDELVDLARRDDRRALDELVRRHHDAVVRLLWSFARSRPDLEDLVQETFLRMLRGLQTWRADRPFRHWLLRIATNTGRDFFRRQSVRRRVFDTDAGVGDDAPPPEPVDAGADPAARAAAAEAKTLLAALPPDDRALLTLHHLEGWGMAEIAQHFGWTLTATKLRAWRARRRLRALLDPPSTT